MHFRKNRVIVHIFILLFLFSNLYAQKETTVVHPEWSKNLSIYEVNIRQYTPEGTFKAFQEHLPRLKEMGFGILWLMPVNPIGEKNRKGPLGSYYSIKDYKAVNPEFGTIEDFKELVNETHKLGMYLIIDWVANHTSWDNEWTETNPEFYKKDSSGNFIPPVADWSDVIALDYGNKDLWNKMIDAMKYWVEETNIDGFRCDVASMVPTPFWNTAREELDKTKHLFMLAEAEATDLHEHAFDMTYAWELHHITKEIYKGDMSVKDLDKYYAKEDSSYHPDSYRMVFTSNHDENSWNGTEFERFGDAVKTFAVLSGVVEGMPLVYSGQEAGMNKALEFFDKDTIDWVESDFRDLYTLLTHLKLKNKALWNGSCGGEMKRIKTNDDENIFAFVREKNDNKIAAVFNLSAEQKKIIINDEIFAGNYRDLFSNEELTLSSEYKGNLPAWGYKVFVK